MSADRLGPPRRETLTFEERRKFPRPLLPEGILGNEGVAVSPDMVALSYIVANLGFVPNDVDGLKRLFWRSNNAEVIERIDPTAENTSLAEDLAGEYSQGLQKARNVGPILNKSVALSQGGSGLITLKNVARGPSIKSEPPEIGVVVEKRPNGMYGSGFQIKSEIETIQFFYAKERRSRRAQRRSYFPEIRTLSNTEFQMPFFPINTNVAYMAQRELLRGSQLRHVMDRYFDFLSIVVNGRGRRTDKEDNIQLLTDGSVVVLDHDTTFSIDGKMYTPGAYPGRDFNEYYTVPRLTMQSGEVSLKRFIQLADLIKDVTLGDKLTMLYYRLEDASFSDPNITPQTLRAVVRNLDNVGIEDLMRKPLSAIVSELDRAA